MGVVSSLLAYCLDELDSGNKIDVNLLEQKSIEIKGLNQSRSICECIHRD